MIPTIKYTSFTEKSRLSAISSEFDDGLTGLGFHAKQSYHWQNYGATEGSPCLI
jgi:hypothetical protein